VHLMTPFFIGQLWSVVTAYACIRRIKLIGTYQR
jgi:hypothetical protein